MDRKLKMIGATTLASLLIFGMSGCGGGDGDNNAEPQTQEASVTATQKRAVLTSYADIAFANYTDAYNDAVALQSAIATFATTPDAANFTAAKDAWLQSRESYGPTEVFRLSEGPIDAEGGWVEKLYGALEGQMNAWPLDENMIDYTIEADGSTSSGNIIDTAGLFTPRGGDEVNVTTITKAALAELNENGGDANVATGYHAIEFLLWGQDQDYNSFIDDTITNGARTAGERPLTDFTSAANADRRLAYLQAAADLLVDDLGVMVDAWSKSAASGCTSGANATGCYRSAFLGTTVGDATAINTDTALRQVFAGLGVFMKSELANERMAVAVLTPSEEDEHSCFSDNTHRDIVTNYEGFKNVIKGEYAGATPVNAAASSVYSLLDTTTKADLDALLASIDTKIAAIDTAAKTTEHFDYQIKDGSSHRQNIVDAKNALRDLGDVMVDIAADYGINLSQEDVTDPDETVVN